jgi:hypothetical protein
MDISYRRTAPSLLEHGLARLLKGCCLSPTPPVQRLDLVHNVDLKLVRS